MMEWRVHCMMQHGMNGGDSGGYHDMKMKLMCFLNAISPCINVF